MSRVIKCATNITAHAWSPDRKQIAICPNTEDVLIYSGADSDDFSKWKLVHTLKGHDLVVSAIDWSPVHSKIVTCSHDRNAFVWTLKDGEWKPSLSILRINRAALAVKWSPDGKKFAVASGAKVVPVCHYEEQNDWWISKMVKKHKSTVLGVAWHPNSQLLATASSDFRCRVFSAYIPEVDGAGTDAILCGNTKNTAFGDLLAEFDSSTGWVESVSWSPNGLGLAFVGHDSSVTFVNWDDKAREKEPAVITIKEKFLPANHVCFLSDSVCITVGHNLAPAVYQHPGLMRGNWKFLGFTEKEPEKRKDDKPKDDGKEKDFGGARSLWANKTTKGSENASAVDAAELWTKHANSVTDIKPYGDTQWSTKVDAFSTCGMDGKVVVWLGRDFKNVVPGLTL